jgi:CBS domain-containing protein
MARLVREVMTKNPVTMDQSRSVVDAARAMRQHGIGDVIVMDGNRFHGIVTDRDIVVRAVAEGNVSGMSLGSICSTEVATVSPDDPLERVSQLMRERAVRRVPVLDGGRPVGIVSMGDLSVAQDPGSLLGDISSAPMNR